MGLESVPTVLSLWINILIKYAIYKQQKSPLPIPLNPLFPMETLICCICFTQCIAQKSNFTKSCIQFLTTFNKQILMSTQTNRQNILSFACIPSSSSIFGYPFYLTLFHMGGVVFSENDKCTFLRLSVFVFCFVWDVRRIDACKTFSVQFSPLTDWVIRETFRGMIQQRSSSSLFLQEALVSSSGMGRDVHSLMLSVQHFLCWPWRHPPPKVP